MSMRMEMAPRLLMECLACGGKGEHESGCPTGAIEKLYEGEMRWRCGGDDCTGRVSVTKEDFLQCRECGRKYSRGTICDVEEPERVLLHRVNPDEDFEFVLAFSKRGKKRGTVYKTDVTIKMLRKQEVEWRRARREERRKRRREKTG